MLAFTKRIRAVALVLPPTVRKWAPWVQAVLLATAHTMFVVLNFKQESWPSLPSSRYHSHDASIHGDAGVPDDVAVGVGDSVGLTLAVFTNVGDTVGVGDTAKSVGTAE